MNFFHCCKFVTVLALISAVVSTAQADVGTIAVKAHSIVVQDDSLIEEPYVQAGVYIDSEQPRYETPAAHTDNNGEVTLQLEEGVHTLKFGKATGQYSFFTSDAYTIVVTANETTVFEESLVTTWAQVFAEGDAGWGYAYFISGESDLLGDWNTAVRMESVGTNLWRFGKALPLGLQYKIVRAPWSLGEIVATDSVEWEQGWNRRIEYVSHRTNYVIPEF